MELLSLNDFRDKKSVVNTEEFKNFVNEERNRVICKKYDMDINIRDLYPINIHTVKTLLSIVCLLIQL